MFVLDSSAVLALLLEEEGAEMIGPITRGAELSVVNLCEVLTKTAEAGGDPEMAQAIVMSYGIRIRAFREGHAIETARLRPLTAHLGLSLGDRACLVQATMSVLPILTSDRQMAKADLGLDIRLIR